MDTSQVVRGMRWRGRGGGVTVRLDSTRSGMAALGSELLDGMAGPGAPVYSRLDLPAVDGSDPRRTRVIE